MPMTWIAEDEIRIDLETLLTLDDRFVVAPRQKQRVAGPGIDKGRQRFQLLGRSRFDHRSGAIALEHHEPRQVDPRKRLTRIELATRA